MAQATKTILLADDSVTIQKVVELTFMDEEFEVRSVSNGAEAIARLGESTPDVVIADVHMPGADGYEVCRRSKELHPTVPVLLLVGTFETFDGEAAARAGADGHLKKPFDSQELLRRVRELAAQTSFATPAPAAVAAEPPLDAPGWDPFPEPLDPFAEPEPLAPRVDELAAPAFAAELPPLEPFPDPVSTTHLPEFDPPAPEAAAVFAEAPSPARLSPPASPPVEANGPLSDADVDRIARRMIELLGDKPVRDVAWEVVPDLAEVLLKSRIRELEASAE